MTEASKVKSALEAIVGSGDVKDDDFIITSYSRDISEAPPQRADFIVLPETSEEVSEILKLANQNEISVCVRAGATLGMGVALQTGGILLDMAKMDKILSIDEDKMVVTAQAGCPIYKVIQELRSRGLDLPIRPWFGPGATCAGWISVAGCGTRVARYGCTGEWTMGVQVVLATGEIVWTGSALLENSTSFMQSISGGGLYKIFLSSYGVFGVITEVAFAMIAMPEAIEHLAFGFDDATSWAKAGYWLQRKQVVTNIDFEDSDLFNHFIEINMPNELIICASAEGYKEEVKRKIEIADEICEVAGGHRLSKKLSEVTHDNNATFSFRSAHFGKYSVGASLHSYATFPAIYKTTKDTYKKYGVRNGWFAWSNFPSWIVTFPICYYQEPSEYDAMTLANLELNRARLEIPDQWPAPVKPEYQELLKKIKNALDPKGILNPGGGWNLVSGATLDFVKSMPLPDK